MEKEAKPQENPLHEPSLWEVLEAMIKDNSPHLKVFPMSNFRHANLLEDGWGAIEMAVDAVTVHQLMTQKPTILFMVVMDGLEYDKYANGLSHDLAQSSDAGRNPTDGSAG